VAVHKAAEYLNLTLDENDTTDVDFYIDNQAAILSLTGTECSSKTAQKCREQLKTLGKNRQIKLHWVKAHKGHSLKS